MTKFTLLGSGTSHGVPVLGCNCPVCKSNDSRDKRYRSSLLIEKEEIKVVIDTGYEFRLQGLRENLDYLDGVLYTHNHADHTEGLDDLRSLSGKKEISVYSFPEILDSIEKKFPYAFKLNNPCSVPRLKKVEVFPQLPFQIGQLKITPLRVLHGKEYIASYRIDSALYLTDTSDPLIEENREFFKGLDLLIVGALREKSHPKHFSFQEALSFAEKIGVKKVVFTHISHSHFHAEIEEKYKNRAKVGYDRLILEV